MPPKARGKAKATTRGSVSSKRTQNTGEPPDPFNKAPTKLNDLLETFDPKHIYITSIDTKPWQFKAKIFSVPLIMNVILVALMAWRLWAIYPYYLKIFASTLGYPNETSMDVSRMSWREIGFEVGRRTLNGMLDLCLWVFIFPWPRDFFISYNQGTPVLWRASVGFRDKELTVRKSRRWVEAMGDIVTENMSKAEGGRLFQANVKQATSREFMYDRTGYLMMNNEWELDWTVMIIATHMIDCDELAWNDFKTTSIFVHSDVYGWVTYDAHDTNGVVREEEGQRKITAFKDRLTAMGKENLFFRWIELMQFESTQPGGFTPERQQLAAMKVKEMFESQGVDFEKFWEEIGGMEDMPGMQQS